MNLCFHSGLNAEAHFFAISHGKRTCDGIGEIVKRLAWILILKIFRVEILKLHGFFNGSIKTLKTSKCVFCLFRRHHTKPFCIGIDGIWKIRNLNSSKRLSAPKDFIASCYYPTTKSLPRRYQPAQLPQHTSSRKRM